MQLVQIDFDHQTAFIKRSKQWQCKIPTAIDFGSKYHRRNDGSGILRVCGLSVTNRDFYKIGKQLAKL